MNSSATATHVSDFYQQLALLVRANLPLPDSLRQLGKDFPQPEFQNVLLEISKRTERGQPLAEALYKFPAYFSPFHVQLVAAGEATGTLPEVLFTIARSARFAQLFIARIRDVIAYPLLTINLALLIMCGISIFVIPVFAEFYEDLLWGARLPPLTQLVVGLASLVQRYWYIFLVLQVVLLGGSLWVFTPGLSAHRALLRLTTVLPGSCRLMRSLDAARLCGMWSAFIKQNMPLPEALAASSRLVERGALAVTLTRMADRAKSGTAMVDLMACEREIDRLIALTFAHTPEADLPAELGRLAQLFEHRVSLAARSATITWSAVSIILMTVLVGAVVIAMFTPLVMIVGALGG